MVRLQLLHKEVFVHSPTPFVTLHPLDGSGQAILTGKEKNFKKKTHPAVILIRQTGGHIREVKEFFGLWEKQDMFFRSITK